jgi:hypothetical protein
MSRISVSENELLVPQNILDATNEYSSAEYELDQVMDFRKYLKQIDSRLDVIWVKPGAKVFPKGNRWYIIRRNETVMPSFWLVEDEHENYCVPDERHLNKLREYDTAAHPDVWKKFQRAHTERKLRAEKAIEAKREEFRTKLAERLDHVFDANILVTPAMKDQIEGVKPPPLPPKQQRARRRHKNR